MGCCGDASVWAKIGLFCTICALGLHTAGYLTNNWMVYNTLEDQIDIRVGLFWFTNCSYGISCYSQSTPSLYVSSLFTVTQVFEGGTVVLLLTITILYCLYVMVVTTRTRPIAVAIIIVYVIAVGFSVIGLAVWISQIDYPYFMEWSAGLTVVAIAFSLMALLCIIPDIREYPYKRLPLMPKKPEKHGTQGKFNKKRDSTDKFSRREPHSDVRNSRDIENDKSRRFPYPFKNKQVQQEDEFASFDLTVASAEPAPWTAFFNKKKDDGIDR